uniref:Uncharacterized protein n=1 Tax=Timema cristinae TaxID=61476 RepID=A0A7R9CQ67_TIMCR|nr:unnamed protein product [Timema cristinae]
MQVMATEDSMSDDVFESLEDGGVGRSLNVLPTPGQQQFHKTPSPTGYRDYKPPADLLKMYDSCGEDEAEQKVHKKVKSPRSSEIIQDFERVSEEHERRGRWDESSRILREYQESMRGEGGGMNLLANNGCLLVSVVRSQQSD